MNFIKKLFYVLSLAFLLLLSSCKNKTISFFVDGKTYATVDYSKDMKLPNTPTKRGYTFVGWYVGGNEYNPAKNTKKPVEARFTPNIYTVTFGSNKVDVVYDSKITNIPEIPSPEEGFSVDGWYIGSTLIDSNFVWTFNANMTAEARYIPNKYILSLGDSQIEVKYGDKIGKLPDVPTKDGYNGVWTIENDDLTANTIWIYKENKTASISYKKVSYILTLGETNISIEYGDTIGNKYVEPPLEAGYDTYWSIDGVKIDSNTVFNYTKNVTAVCSKTPKNNTSYTIKHFLESSNNNGFEEVESEREIKYGTTDTLTQAVSKDFEHYSARDFNQFAIKGDGSTTIIIYYNIERIKVNVVYNDNEEIIDAKYNQVISTLKAPQIKGLTFGYWEIDGVKCDDNFTITSSVVLTPVYYDFNVIKNITNSNDNCVSYSDNVYTVKNPGYEGYVIVSKNYDRAYDAFEYDTEIHYDPDMVQFQIGIMNSSMSLVNTYEFIYEKSPEKFYISAVNETRTLWTDSTYANLGSEYLQMLRNGKIAIRMIKEGTTVYIRVGSDFNHLNLVYAFDNPSWNAFAPEYGTPCFVLKGKQNSLNTADAKISNTSLFIPKKDNISFIEHNSEGTYQSYGININQYYKDWIVDLSRITVGNPGKHEMGWEAFTSIVPREASYEKEFIFITRVQISNPKNLVFGINLYDKTKWQDQILINYNDNLDGEYAWISFHEPNDVARNSKDSWGVITGDLLEILRNGDYYVKVKYSDGKVTVGIGENKNSIQDVITVAQDSGDWIRPHTTGYATVGLIVFGRTNTDDYVTLSDFHFIVNPKVILVNEDIETIIYTDDSGHISNIDNPSKEGYQFLGYYVDGRKIDENTVFEKDTRCEAVYEALKYELLYNDTTIECTYDKAIGELPQIEEREGYVGYYTIDEKPITSNTIWKYTSNKTMVLIYIQANENVNYRVEHMKENIYDDDYTLFEYETLSGKPGEYTNALSKTYAHYSASSFEQETISIDGSTIIRIYYNLEKVAVTLVKNNGEDNQVVQVKCFTKVADLPIPKLSYHTFSNWGVDSNMEIESSMTLSASYDNFFTIGENRKDTKNTVKNVDGSYTVYGGNAYSKENIFITELSSKENFEFSYKVTTTSTHLEASFGLYDSAYGQDSVFTILHGNGSDYVEGVRNEPFAYNDNTYGGLTNESINILDSGSYYVKIIKTGNKCWIQLGSTIETLETICSFDSDWNSFAPLNAIPSVRIRSNSDCYDDYVIISDIVYTIIN